MTDSTATEVGDLDVSRTLSRSGLAWLVVAQTLTLVCDGIAAVSIPLILLERSVSGTIVGTCAAAASTGAAVGLLVSSGYIDRVSKRTALQIFEIVRLFAIVLFVVSCNWADSVVVPGVLAASFLVGLSAACYRPLLSAYIGEVVDEKSRLAANGIRSSTSKVAAIITPAAGGAFAAFSPWFSMIIVAGTTCTTSFVILSRLVRDRVACTTGNGFLRESAGGFRYCWKNRVLRQVMIQGVIQLGIAVPPLTPLLAIHLRHANSSGFYGLFFTVEALGAIAGSMLAMKIGLTATRSVLTVTAACGAALPLAIVVDNVWFGFTVYLIAGLGLGCFGVVWMSFLQSAVDRQYLGRVLNVDSLGTVLVAPFATLLATMSINWLSPSALGIVLTVIGALSVLLLLRVRISVHP